jgi:DNA polymerase-3 subunit delta'
VIGDTVAAAGGDLSRARILANDPALVERRRAFAEIPRRLDGTGAAVVTTVDELLARIEDAAAPLVARQTAEVAELDARAEQFGERGSGRRTLEERHRRELRRHRTDELRSGLGVLAGAYRDRLVTGSGQRPDALVAAVERIHEAIEAMEHNPNEPLLLQSLLWNLPIDGS